MSSTYNNCTFHMQHCSPISLIVLLLFVVILIWTENVRSHNYAHKSAPLPHCDALTSAFDPCSPASMAFQCFLLQKLKRGANSSPIFMDHPVKLTRPLVPCSGLTASLNKVPINNNLVTARISYHAVGTPENQSVAALSVSIMTWRQHWLRGPQGVQLTAYPHY
jgi:hypothetical protein